MNRYAITVFAASLMAAAPAPAAAGDTWSREPTVTQLRAAARQDNVGNEAVVTRERAFDRAPSAGNEEGLPTPRLSSQPEGEEKDLIKSPGPASSFELVPDEADTRCRRVEGQMRCTPVLK
jgi:hypothetical protein